VSADDLADPLPCEHRQRNELTIVMDTVEAPPVSGPAQNAWRSVWLGLEEAVSEAREILGGHLREAVFSTHELSDGDGRQAGEVRIGRSRLRLECAAHCSPAAPDEPLLREAFGPDAPLARIFVYRESGHGRLRLESMLVVSTDSGVWISTDPELGPASITDRGSLERFYWSLLVDRR
jgi:hypothetical protein